MRMILCAPLSILQSTWEIWKLVILPEIKTATIELGLPAALAIEIVSE
jgi:hypothetical protein